MNNKKSDILQELVEQADKKSLEELIVQLATKQPDTRRFCLEFLKKCVPSIDMAKTDREIIFTLWNELEPDLSDLDEYGGGHDNVVDRVGNLLYELSEKLKENKIEKNDREILLNEIFSYIESGNAGMDGTLYEVAYASCHDDDDLKDLAERFEDLNKEWPLQHARRIYRKLGDREKYLYLRLRQMHYGDDYHDLATFYWEIGEKEKALQIAKQGLEKGTGRMDELRAFLSTQAQANGDRKGYLDLQFDQITDRLSLESYKSFKQICHNNEWQDYEQKLLKRLAQAGKEEQLKIHMFRQEYDHALNLILKMYYPNQYEGSTSLKIATQLEEKYPEEILKFYQSGLGNLDYNDTRQAYAAKAVVASKIRHVWVDLLGMKNQWQSFAKQIKIRNIKRPAFQEEFAKRISEWREL